MTIPLHKFASDNSYVSRQACKRPTRRMICGCCVITWYECPLDTITAAWSIESISMSCWFNVNALCFSDGCLSHGYASGYIGLVCPFSHGQAEVMLHPARFRTERCFNTACRGLQSGCTDAHSLSELRMPVLTSPAAELQSQLLLVRPKFCHSIWCATKATIVQKWCSFSLRLLGVPADVMFTGFCIT